MLYGNLQCTFQRPLEAMDDSCVYLEVGAESIDSYQNAHNHNLCLLYSWPVVDITSTTSFR